MNNLTSIAQLNLYGNQLSGTLPRDICLNMPDLRAFDLGNSLFSVNIPKEFGNCSSLSDLFVRENNLIGTFFHFLFPRFGVCSYAFHILMSHSNVVR